MKESEIQVLGQRKTDSVLRTYWPWLAASAIVLLMVGILIGRFAIRESQIRTDRGTGCTIDSTLQQTVDSLLQQQMRDIGALSGQAIVMEVATGRIRAMVGLQRRYDGRYESCRNFGQRQSSGLVTAASLLALLETETCDLRTKVDVEEGVMQFDDVVIKDHNWLKGGYGQLTMEQVLGLSSDIGICKPVWAQFGKKPQAFLDKLEAMGVGLPASVDGIAELEPFAPDSLVVRTDLLRYCLGAGLKVAPIQMLTFYNALANDGVMVKPTLYEDSTVVLVSQVAQSRHVMELRAALATKVTEGLVMKAATQRTEVAGNTATALVAYGDGEEVPYSTNNNEYHVEFCGYFPARHPKYSIIVSLNKIGIPASGGAQAAPVFRQIVEYICEREIALQNITSAR